MRSGTYSLLLLSLLLLGAGLEARDLDPPGYPVLLERPPEGMKVHNLGRVWSCVSNVGTYGDANSVLPTYDWPGGQDPYYLWEGRLWIGATVAGEHYVSHAGYGEHEFAPSEGGDWVIEKPGTSMMDICCAYDDWAANNQSPLGLKIAQRAMQWSVEGYNDFIAYEYRIIYDADSSFLAPNAPDPLEDVYIAWTFDADVGGEVSTDPNLDDLVSYDGWTDGEWDRAYPVDTYPYDLVTLNPDGTILEEPDGVCDQLTVFGDEPEEVTVDGDTLHLWRNASYIYDGDSEQRAGDDEGENGKVPGYIAGRCLYAPPGGNDSLWVQNGDTCRVFRPMSHTWWNWENDPGTDGDKYLYMIGEHPFCKVGDDTFHFMMHPFDWSSPVFDYRFLLTYGPYEIEDKDTLEFVFVGLVGFGLDGGYAEDEGVSQGIFQAGAWYPGMRWVADQALKAYYMGSQSSDPVHPSSPSEDIHWLIPIPPEVPTLQYSAGQGVVTLAWDDRAEMTPDPLDGLYDFVGYRVYRCEFKIGNWVLLRGWVDEDYAALHPDSFPSSQYARVGVGEFPHTYVDTSVIYGIPYFYAVTSFDCGRDTTQAPVVIPSLESTKGNYKQTELGAEIPLFVKTERQVNLNRVTVAPNPYVGSARWERKYEDRIQFMNLPGSCRILVYTISGDLVQELVHTDGSGDHYWDLLSRNNQSVASGIYVYKIEARDDATNEDISKLGKIVILR